MHMIRGASVSEAGMVAGNHRRASPLDDRNTSAPGIHTRPSPPFAYCYHSFRGQMKLACENTVGLVMTCIMVGINLQSLVFMI